jgi:NADH:ubiquinone oxidoreductase subunit 2 (subunit N)
MLSVIILIGLFLKNTGNHVKILNLTSALIFAQYLISYGYDNFQTITLMQNFTYFAHLFIYIAIFIAIVFFLSISQKNFFKENTKIEFTLLIWCIIIASEYLISSLDFISIIILIECIAFSSYVLVGFDRKNKFSVTSGLQYLILASIPGGLFILGLILFYNNFGTFTQSYLTLLLESLNENILNTNSMQNWDIMVTTTFLSEELLGDHNMYFYSQQHLLELIKYFNKILTQVNWTCGMLSPYLVIDYFNLVKNNYDTSVQIILENFNLFPMVDFSSVQEGVELTGFFMHFFNIIENSTCDTLETYYQFINFLFKNLVSGLAIIYSFGDASVIEYNWSWDIFFSNYDYFTDLATNNLGLINIWGWLVFLNEVFVDEMLAKNLLENVGVRDLVTHSPWVSISENLNLFGEDYILGFQYWMAMTSTPENLKFLNLLLNDFQAQIKFIRFSESFALHSFGMQLLINKTIGSMFIENRNFWDEILTPAMQVKLFGLDAKDAFLWHAYRLNNEVFNLCHCNINCRVQTSPELLQLNTIISNSQVFSSSEYDIESTHIYLYLALIFILANLSFKLTAAPFHFWAPSVYGGSPLVTLTFLSIFSKTIFIFFSIWLFVNVFDSLANIWQFLILIIAFLSILISIIGAFSEKIFKRFFVYSSTGHVGFMLLGLVTLNTNGLKGTVDYLILYILSSFIVWFIIMHLTKKTITLINLKGLSYNQPYLSLIFSIILFSLSGIPPLGGFFVKYEIFYSLINSSFFFLAYVLLLLTVISFFYYIRLIKIFYFENNKKFYKFKNFDDIKLRLISYGFFIIPFFILFSDNAISIFITNIIVKSLF